MRIAVPIWQDKVSPLLDAASRLLIVETEDKRESSRFETVFDEVSISRRCQRIQGLKVDVLICGALSRSFSMMLKGAGIHIISGIFGPLEEILQAFFQKTLSCSSYLMPGYELDSQMQTDSSLPSKRTKTSMRRNLK